MPPEADGLALDLSPEEMERLEECWAKREQPDGRGGIKHVRYHHSDAKHTGVKLPVRAGWNRHGSGWRRTSRQIHD